MQCHTQDRHRWERMHTALKNPQQKQRLPTAINPSKMAGKEQDDEPGTHQNLSSLTTSRADEKTVKLMSQARCSGAMPQLNAHPPVIQAYICGWGYWDHYTRL